MKTRELEKFYLCLCTRQAEARSEATLTGLYDKKREQKQGRGISSPC